MEEGEKKLYTDPVTGEQVSKKELKKREKMRKKEEELAKKKKEKEGKEKKEKEGGEKKPNKNKGGEEELDPTKYFENRKAFLLGNRIRKKPFPSQIRSDHRSS